MADKMLDKLAKLLNQAERASSAEEADAFMARAQVLATTHSIDLAIARQHTAKKEQREQPTQKWITIGERRKGNLRHLCELFYAIASQNDLKVDLASNSTFVIAFGMPSDIEVTEVLYASLAFQMVEAANAWLKTGEYKKELVYRTVTKRDGIGLYKHREQVPMHGKVARANFYDAYIRRIQSRLADARSQALEIAKEKSVEVVDENDNVITTSAEVVLRSKAIEVRDFHKTASKAKGNWKGAKTSRYSETAHSAGDTAARSARLGSNRAIGGSRTSIAA